MTDRRHALVCVALAGCTPVSWWTTPSAIQTNAPALRLYGSATLEARNVDERPQLDPPSPEPIRLDQPIGVRLAAQSGDKAWVASQAQSETHDMTIANLIADCPLDIENTPANRRAYPHCTLFRAADIRLRSGYRATRSDIIISAGLVVLAGDVTCIFECNPTGARVSEAALGVGAVAAIVVGFYYLLKGIGDEDFKH